jgi:hypothetical protein
MEGAMSGMTKRLPLLCGLLWAVAPAAAEAGTCGVLPFTADAKINKGAAPNITALVSSEADIRGGWDLVITAEASEFSGDCSKDVACLKTFGKDNGHEAIIGGHVAPADATNYELTLRLYDGKSGAVLREVVRDVPMAADQLMNAVGPLVVELATGKSKPAPAEAGKEEKKGEMFADVDFEDLLGDEEAPAPKEVSKARTRNPNHEAEVEERAEEDDPFALGDEEDLDLDEAALARKQKERERAEAEAKRAEEEKRRIDEERAAREREDRERAAREAAERRRIEEEREAAEARRADEERRARERAERERLAREEAERERMEEERRESEARAERARIERERQEQIEAERRAADARAQREREERERIEQADEERRAEAARVARERADAAREEDEAADRERAASAARREEELRRVEARSNATEEVRLASAVSLAPAGAGIIIGGDDDDWGDDDWDEEDDDPYRDDEEDGEEDDEADAPVARTASSRPQDGAIIGEVRERGGSASSEAREESTDRYSRARAVTRDLADDASYRRPSSRADEEADERSRTPSPRRDESASRPADDDGADGSGYSRTRGASEPSSGYSRAEGRSRSADDDRDEADDDRAARATPPRDERVASRDVYEDADFDELEGDSDRRDLSLSRSAGASTRTSSDRPRNRPWFAARVSGGYANYYLHFAQYGVDVSVFAAPVFSVDLAADFWTLSLKECDACAAEYRTLPSFSLGVAYRFTNLKVAQPYVGGDFTSVVYAIGTLTDEAGVETRRPMFGAGGLVKGGADLMVTRHFGLSLGVEIGVGNAPRIKELVHPDWKPLQFLVNGRAAAVVQF